MGKHGMVVPTYVGVIPASAIVPKAVQGGPHVCGGDPNRRIPDHADFVWSPRMWG